MSTKASKSKEIDLSSVMEMLNAFQAGHFSKLLSQNDDPNLKPLINKINETAKVLEAQAQSYVIQSKELVERERVWRHLMKHSPVGIYQTDKDGKCIYVNDKWSELTGLSYDEAAGWGWATALHPEDKEEISRRWKLFVAGESFSMQYRFMKKNGDVIFVTGDANPVLNERKEVEGYLGTVLDISELKLKQAALINSTRLASLGEMSAGIAHEVNNPLAIIKAKAAMLIRKAGDPTFDWASGVKDLKTIETTADRIAKIVKALRTYSREAENDPMEEHNLLDIIYDTFELCRERFTIANIDVQLQVGSSINIRCRPAQISQVFMNLLSNSYDALEDLDSKWVKIIATQKNGNINIQFIDSGSALPEKVAQKMMNPFFTTKEVGKGIGLGLSISTGIIKKHGGVLAYDQSAPNTTFTIDLPDAQQLIKSEVA